MSKTKTVYECQTCGSQFPKWIGRCSECGAWNSVVESLIESQVAGLPGLKESSNPLPLSQVDVLESTPIPTNVKEFDHVLGGGLVPGSVTLIGGEPGIGKSTLVMQVLSSLANNGAICFYASAEESSAQIRGRAGRLKINSDDIYVSSTSNVDEIIIQAKNINCKYLVVDSIHTLLCDEISSTSGTVSQVRECAHRLTDFAKKTNTTVLVVGQVTKEGTLAGPRVLEHLVDTVLSFEGDDHGVVRTLRCSKHRFGSVQELGLFDMTEHGLIALDDPSSLMSFTNDSRPSGLAVAAAVDGTRPFLIEVQALVVSTTAPNPRRVVQGVDSARINALLAVLEKRCSIRLSICDVYVSLVGGIKIKDPGLDLAICVAIASASKDITVSKDNVFSGEVGLSSEIRPCMHVSRRIREASRRGHKTITTNIGKTSKEEFSKEKIEVINADSLYNVLSSLDLLNA
ncbi:MAG: DNA repair protein RadA [Acidimicrobiia bacterium]